MKSFFKDASGNVVIAQKPNAPIIAWALFKVASLIPISTTLADIFSLLAFGALFTWAWLEIFSGVNIFRRALGVTVMAVSILVRVWV